jgi:hypothetical protein
MTKSEDPSPRGEEPEHTGDGPILKKERLDKDDGRYIIFYTFGDETEEHEEKEEGEED